MSTINLNYIWRFSSYRAVNTPRLYQDRQMYVLRKIKACSCKHRCSGKAIRITHSECVFVALVFMRANRRFSASSFVVTCGLSGSTILLNFATSKMARFWGGGVIGRRSEFL